MNQQIIYSCLPWAILMVLSVVAARVLIQLSGAKLDTTRVRSIHNCQDGSVQGISFVLVLPFFVMIIMMIVQASHLMIGNIMVHYSAFAAVRSASVWIPANVSVLEPANCISSRTQISEDDLGEQYEIGQFGEKFSKIHQAAVLANFSLGPSRNLGYELDDNQKLMTADAVTRLYSGLNSESDSNSRISDRIRNKLAYTYANTNVDLTVWHRFRENTNGDRELDDKGRWSEVYPLPRPWAGLGYGDRDAPLDEYVEGIGMYEPNEFGWQDHITATVTFNLPLLPGPMRFFAPIAENLEQTNDPATDLTGNTYIWPITGNATLGNEGEKPNLSYWQEEF